MPKIYKSLIGPWIIIAKFSLTKQLLSNLKLFDNLGLKWKEKKLSLVKFTTIPLSFVIIFWFEIFLSRLICKIFDFVYEYVKFFLNNISKIFFYLKNFYLSPKVCFYIFF